MKHFIIFCALQLFIIVAQAEFNNTERANKTAILAFAFFRHGIRAPDSLYPTDPLTNVTAYWPNGLSQLTDKGKEQMFDLGKYAGRRYRRLIKDVYHVQDFLATSTDVDRVIMSANLVTAGMYPNKNNTGNFSYEKLNSQPVPVHTIPAGVNRLMLHTSFLKDPAVCPKYYQLFNNLSYNPQLNETYYQNQQLIEYIFNQSGTGNQNIPSTWWWNIGNTVLTIYYERYYGLQVPDWAEETFSSETNRTYLNGLLRFLTITEEMKRLAAGPILKEITQKMDNKIAGTESKSFFLYSVHGANLVNILNTLGLFDPPTFPYPDSSALFVELHKIEEEYFVKVFYRNGITNELTQLGLPNCPEPCTLNSFETSVQNYTSVNLAVECQIN